MIRWSCNSLRPLLFSGSLKRFGLTHSTVKSIMTEKAFAKGSPFPVLEDGKLRIYNMRFCPYAERTKLVLYYLNIPHETININLKSKPEWFLERNPLGLVPVLEQGKQIIYESSICDEYLDEVYGKHKLLTNDPYTRARRKILMERFNISVVMPFYSTLKRLTDEEKLKAFEKAQNGLDVFEKVLKGRFFGGSELSMVDFHVWPWFERFPMFQQITGMEILPRDRYPKLNSWMECMMDLSCVKKVLLSTDLHIEFIIKLKSKDGQPYDVGLNLSQL